jgi:hypothetical protein
MRRQKLAPRSRGASHPSAATRSPRARARRAASEARAGRASCSSHDDCEHAAVLGRDDGPEAVPLEPRRATMNRREEAQGEPTLDEAAAERPKLPHTRLPSVAKCSPIIRVDFETGEGAAAPRLAPSPDAPYAVNAPQIAAKMSSCDSRLPCSTTSCSKLRIGLPFSSKPSTVPVTTTWPASEAIKPGA